MKADLAENITKKWLLLTNCSGRFRRLKTKPLVWRSYWETRSNGQEEHDCKESEAPEIGS